MIKGDKEAFSMVYEQYARTLYCFGLNFTSRQDIIEDCIQDLFISLLKKKSRFGIDDNPQYYLLKAFRNNLFRLLKREQIYQEVTKGNYDFEAVFSIEESIIRSETKNQQKKVLLDSLKSLSSRQKEAIYLRYTKGFEYKQVAGIMDMEIESCRNLISRALNKLRKTMKEDIGIILYLLSTYLK